MESIAGLLSAEGDLSVDIALSGEAALEKLAIAQFDAVVSDYLAPPAMNGIDLLRNARARGYRGLFLLFTERCDEDLALDAILNGADHFLPRREGSRKDVALVRSILLRRAQREEGSSGRLEAGVYHAVLMRLADGFACHQVITDSSGTAPTIITTDANEAFDRTFLPPGESVLGRDLRTLLRSSDPFESRLGKAIEDAITNGAEGRFTERSTDRDQWFEVSIYAPLPGHIVTVVSNVTELRRAEKEVEQGRRKMSFLGSQVRHDLLNQLTALNGFLTLSQLKVEDASVKEFLGKAGASGNRMRKILELSREFEQLGAPPTWVPAQQAAEKGLAQAQKDPSRVRIELDGLEVYADPRLDMVFRTLVENAFAHGNATEVHIFKVTTGDEVRIVCRDNGTGIPEGRRRFIFDDRLDHGLFLVKEALSMTGMLIEETSRGGGACFEVRVPPGRYRLPSPG